MHRTVLALTVCAALTLAPAWPVFAQQTKPSPASEPAADPGPDAQAISAQIFGGTRPHDEAYGAYQRGLYLTALALALPRAQKDDGPAQTLIAEIYANGLGVARDMKKAASWYALGDKNGDVNATYALAVLYQNGAGVDKDPARAAQLFEKAAQKGDPRAKYNVALLYVEGRQVPPNQIKAAKLMADAAAAGLPEAQYDYGVMLTEGAGVAPDTAKGAEQIERAAEAGLPAAQVEYATMLYLGEGVSRDKSAAAGWYRRAANLGNPVAQNRLAKLLAVGEGVKKDLEDAVMWRELARRQGLTDPQTDQLLESAPDETVQQGEMRARYWPGQPPQSAIPDGQRKSTGLIAPSAPNLPLDAKKDPADAPSAP